MTDGTAVLGLGAIGPEAALPVMEGKALLFKEFAGIDAFPICLATTEAERIVETVRLIAPVFGGINLEDISAPRCFEVEQRLNEVLDIPVFHDDQHGTAVVVLAALLNALRLVRKEPPQTQGRGVRGRRGGDGDDPHAAACRRRCHPGVDEHGIRPPGRPEPMDPVKAAVAGETNPPTSGAGSATRWRAPTSSSACPPRAC